MEQMQYKFVTQFFDKNISDDMHYYMETLSEKNYELINSLADFPELSNVDVSFENKRDLVRYYTLYKKGGLFVNTNVLALEIDELYEYDLVLVKDDIFLNDIILSKPGLELFETLYKLLLKNIQNNIRIDYKQIFHITVDSFIKKDLKIKILKGKREKFNRFLTKNTPLPKGSWIYTSQDYSMEGNSLTCMSQDTSGNLKKNIVNILPGIDYYNNNGYIDYNLQMTYGCDNALFVSLKLDENMEDYSYNKRLFMTYKKKVPEKVFKRWKVLNPKYEIEFSLDSDCISFLENINGYISALFKEIPIGMYKADLWRLCKLYINGGVYADVDLVPHINLEYFDKDVSFYSCISAISRNSIFQAFMINYKPKSELIYIMLLSFLLNNPQNFCNGPTFDMFNVLQYNIYEPIQPFRKYTIETLKLEIKIGSSSHNEKRINLFYFPLKDYDIQLKPSGYNDTFEFSVINNILNVKRIDSNEGWGHNHSCELVIKTKEVVYLFDERPGPNTNWATSAVYHEDFKILDSRDMDYFHKGGW